MKPCTFAMCLCFDADLDGKCGPNWEDVCAHYQNKQKAIKKLIHIKEKMLPVMYPNAMCGITGKDFMEVISLIEGPIESGEE